MLSNAQKAVIHVAKSQLGLDDDMYRSVLKAHAGKSSSKDLNYHQFKLVMNYFESVGFQRKGGNRRPYAHKANRPGMATEKQIKKIYAMWWALGGKWYSKGSEFKALRGFLKKRFRVDHENFLTFQKASDVIEALKNIGKRH